MCDTDKLWIKLTVICIGKIVFTRCFLETVWFLEYCQWWIYEIANYAISGARISLEEEAPSCKQLQKVNVDVCTVLDSYDSLTRLVNSEQETFGENEGKALSKVKNKKFQVEEKQFTLIDLEMDK